MGIQVSELNKKIQELKKQEQQGVFGVLTDDQKKAFESAVVAAKKKKDAPKDKKKEPEKKKDQTSSRSEKYRCGRMHRRSS